MFKILLVFDVYSELLEVETTLKKVGLDVVGISSEFAIREQIISINPDAIIGYGSGAKFTSVSIAKKLKEMTRWTGKSILIFTPGVLLQPDDLLLMRMDLMLNSPVSPTRLVQAVAKLLGRDETLFLDKLNKPPGLDKESDSSSGSANFITGNKLKSSTDLPDRVEVRGKVNDPSLGRTDTRGGGGSPEVKKVIKSNDKADPLFKEIDKALKNAPFAGAADGPFSNNEDPEPTVFPTSATETMPEAKESEGSTTVGSQFSNIFDELEKHRDVVSKRVEKYKKIAAEAGAREVASLPILKARKMHRELLAGWDRKALEDLDALRREFANALFAKRK